MLFQLRNSSIIRAMIYKKYSTKPIRVRFAPSPTGLLHLGGLRTALYNYLFANSKNGRMILRIEDTDRSRKVDGAVEKIIQNLEWAGIRCHEGPHEGGSYGPYTQSERIDIYKEQVKTLLNNGSAYKCFCTDNRLKLLKREATRNQQVPKYDNKCRHLTDNEIKEKMNRGESYCIRFKLSSDCSTFDDIIYGPIAYDVSIVEGDPVIIKTDGIPTYHFANVVDDHLMQVSHVLRGVEWQISTTKHLLMYKAFGWKPPIYGHLPLLVNSDGTKLSKRQGDISIADYQKRGIFPEALINFITLSGGGFPHVVGEGICHNSLPELINMFQLENVNQNPSKLNPDLLNECNRLYIIEKIKDEHELNNLIITVRNLITSNFLNKEIDVSTNYIKSVLKWSSGRIKFLEELISPSLSFLWVLPNFKEPLDDFSKTSLKNLLDMLRNENMSFDRECLRVFLKGFSDSSGLKFSKFMQLLRSVLCGLNEGPSVAEIIEILGRDTTICRLEKALNDYK